MMTVEYLIEQVNKACEVFYNFDHPEDTETAEALDQVSQILRANQNSLEEAIQ